MLNRPTRSRSVETSSSISTALTLAVLLLMALAAPPQALAIPPHANVPLRLYCSFQTQIAPFRESTVVFELLRNTQTPGQNEPAPTENQQPATFSAVEISAPGIDSLARANLRGWALRDRSEGHRLILRQAERTARLIQSTTASDSDQEMVDDWSATLRLEAVMTLPGDRPDHWSGTLESSHANWLSYRSRRGPLGSAAQPGPLHFLRRRRELVRHQESNVSAHCARFPIRR